MRVEHYREFAALAHHLNFRETAAQLNVSQSALSRHITALEQYYETELFKRDRHQVHLTEAGAFLLDYAESIIGLADQSRDHLRELFADSRRLHISGIIGHPALYPWAWNVERSLKSANSPISLHVGCNASPLPKTQADNLMAGSADCALLISPLGEELDSDCFDEIFIGSIPTAVVTMKDHPLAGEPYATADMLHNQRFVQFTGPNFSPYWSAFANLLDTAGVKYTTIAVPASNEYDVIRFATTMGKTLYIAPQVSILPLIRQNSDITVVPLEEKSFSLRLTLLYRKGHKEDLVGLVAARLRETLPEFLAEQ